MLVQNLLRDGKAEARAAGFARTRLVHTVEPVKQARQILFGDADAVIRDADKDVSAARADGHVDFAAVGRILDSVGDDVGNDLLDALPVAVDVGNVPLAGERHSVVVVLLGVELCRVIHILHGF